MTGVMTDELKRMARRQDGDYDVPVLSEPEAGPDSVPPQQLGTFPAIVAAGRQVIAGLPDPVLTGYELRAETAMVQALQQVMDTIADRIGQVQTAAGRQPWDGCRHGLHPTHDGPCP